MYYDFKLMGQLIFQLIHCLWAYATCKRDYTVDKVNNVQFADVQIVQAG